MHFVILLDLSIFPSVLFMNIFESIFRMTSSNVIGLMFFTGPLVFSALLAVVGFQSLVFPIVIVSKYVV